MYSVPTLKDSVLLHCLECVVKCMTYIAEDIPPQTLNMLIMY